MRIDFLARESHFIDHLAPIFTSLPDEVRGFFYTTRSLRNHATRNGIYTRICSNRGRLSKILAQRKGPIITASYGDLRIANTSGRPQIFLNHGAGCRYSGDFPSYSGSTIGREKVLLFLSPSAQSAKFDKEACPWAEAVAIGCPKMDIWHQRLQHGWKKLSAKKPTVAISFHFDGGPVPELRSAFAHYQSFLGELARTFNLVGHAHPKWGSSMAKIFKENGIRYEPSFERILEIADLYVCDNSSTTFEFASTNRPVVLLNAPWYRKSWTHPGNPRFWEYANVGLQCDEPEDLIPTILEALKDPPEVSATRQAAVKGVYEVVDGTATSLAVKSVLKVYNDLKTNRLKVSKIKRRSQLPLSILSSERIESSGSIQKNRRFGIIITNRNRTQNLENCLKSIAKQSLRPEWVVLSDLGSKEEEKCTLKWFAKKFGISYLRMDYYDQWNKGMAFNTALRHMPELPNVIQLDADMIFAPDLLEYTAGLLEQHQAISFIPRFISRQSIPKDLQLNWNTYNQLLARSRSTTSGLHGGYVVLPRDWLIANRGIDEHYKGWGMEDSDLWWRATANLVAHVEGNSKRLIHQSHPVQDRKINIRRNKKRYYERLLGNNIPNNPHSWGDALVSEFIMRLGMQATNGMVNLTNGHVRSKVLNL